MKRFYILLLSVALFSCIPIQIAPKIEGAKVMRGKKFKRQLPNQYSYVFEDPKEADEFYSYVNAKFQKVYDDVDGNIKVSIGGQDHFLTFYEVERNTQTVNLVPIIVDAALTNEGYGPVLESAAVSRKGTWYLVLTVTDKDSNDSLHPTHEQREKVHEYLELLRNEYLNTTHYIEVYLKSE